MLFSSCKSGIGRRDILCSGGSAIFSSLSPHCWVTLNRRGRRQYRAPCRRLTVPPFAW